MSRRRHETYDDFYDDGYGDDYDYDDEEEEEEDSSQYAKNEDRTENHVTTEAAQTELLDNLVEDFRVCLGDATIARDQVDAVLVAADYDVDSAMVIMREQIAATRAASRESATRLEALEPSPIARMLESETGDHHIPEMPCAATDVQQPIRGFAFDEPSPDDAIQMRKNAGRARAQAVSSAIVPKPAAVAKKPSKTAAPREKPAPESVKTGATVPSPAKRLTHSKTTAPGLPPAPSQRAGALKIASASDLAARSSSVSIVVAGHVDAGKVSIDTALGRVAEAATRVMRCAFLTTF